jgi:hypothetical protein
MGLFWSSNFNNPEQIASECQASLSSIPLTSEVCIYQGPTSSAGQTAWHPPDAPHIPMYLESTVGGTNGPDPTATKHIHQLWLLKCIPVCVCVCVCVYYLTDFLTTSLIRNSDLTQLSLK